jgi:Ca2+-binding RTX toxin-like protein
VKRVAGDRGDIVLGWLSKLVAALLVLGLVAFDGISLAQARFQAADRATTAALAAADSYKQSRDLQKAYDAALATTQDGDTIETKTFAIDTSGEVKLRLHHEAHTLFVKRIGALKHWTHAVETGTGSPPS